jgi:Na+/phosphate symporter
MRRPGTSGQDEKSQTHASVKAMSALYRLLGWITLGIGFGFALTLFTFAANAHADADKIIALAGGLICIMLTILIFVLTYGFAGVVRMLLEIEDECEITARRITEVADRIEIVPEEPLEEPKVEEIEKPPSDNETSEKAT